MLDRFNNIWVLVISAVIFISVIRKIINLNKPFDEKKFIEQYQNQRKLKNKFNLDNVHKGIPKLASYYVGLS